MLRSKLAFGLLCVLVILLSLGLYSINECSDLGARISLLLTNKDSEAARLQQLRLNLSQINAALFSTVSANSVDGLKRFKDAESGFEKALTGLDSLTHLSDEKKVLIQMLKKRIPDLAADGKQWFSAPAIQRSPDFNRKISEDTLSLMNTLDELSVLHEESLTNDSKESDSRITTTIRLLMLGMIIAIIVSIYTTFLLGRRLLDPLVELTAVVRKIGDGNLDQSIPIRSNDEVGLLAASFNKMAVQLKKFRESASEELLRLNSTIRATLASFPHPVFVLNRQGIVELRNPEADKLAVKLLFAGVHRLPRKVDEKVDEVLSTGKDYVPNSFSDTIRLQIDEQDRYFLPRIVPLRDDNEERFGIAVILEDVTRMRLMDELKSNLVATVSHEIKTPLTSIRMAVYLLAEELIGTLNVKQKDLVVTAREDVDRLLKTLNDLLDLAKLEHGPSELDTALLTPDEIVENALRNVREIAQAASIQLSASIALDLPRVAVDRQRIGFVFNNLLTNAIKYSPSGTKVWIRVELFKEDPSQIRFTVKDQGPGISAEHCARIFDRFYRVQGTDRSGAGLGLFIAREVVNAHGGKIGVNSVPGEGSEFYFHLPVGQSNRPAA